MDSNLPSNYSNSLRDNYEIKLNVIGKKLDTFVVTERLPFGQGGFGQVYKIRDNEQNTFALKTIKCLTQYFSDNGKRKAEEMKVLKHVNIAYVYEFSFINLSGNPGPTTHACILMDYCHGGNLNTRLNQQSSVQQNLTWMVQMASAIEYMHKLNIVHQDLKPGNILLTKDQQIKIADGVLSKEFASWRQDEENVEVDDFENVDDDVLVHFYKKVGQGVAPFLAPELFKEHCQYTKKADIFSLGIIFYAVLERNEITYNGRKMYGAFLEARPNGLGEEMFESQKQINLPFVNSQTQLLQNLVRQMLSFKQTDRPTAEKIQMEFRNILIIQSKKNESDRNNEGKISDIPPDDIPPDIPWNINFDFVGGVVTGIVGVLLHFLFSSSNQSKNKNK